MKRSQDITSHHQCEDTLCTFFNGRVKIMKIVPLNGIKLSHYEGVSKRFRTLCLERELHTIQLSALDAVVSIFYELVW